MGPKLASRIYKDINEVIKEIDSEIELFCMHVSDVGKKFIFTVT